ncbi:MAG: DAK2 domain-containing protein [Dehalococcoidales bacterium]|nr:DAK2 domain-containing protein [Dehalococcoidales bacterium]
MKQTDSIGGQEFLEMFAAATDWLEKSASDIDALNVFPVPDGDTGTNMLLTMRSTIEHGTQSTNHSASAVAQAMANGALMGARGNSGVILSQFWTGLAHGLGNKDVINGKDFASALEQASIIAYKGVSNPVEGTILTVLKDASKSALIKAANGHSEFISVMESAVNAANESVANTPTLLPVLREAGVVDSGGQGLYTILDGALRYLRGEAELMQFRKPQIIASSIPLTTITITSHDKLDGHEIPFGYCTEFLIKGKELDPDKLRKHLLKKGESLIVVGDDTMIRVHIHALDPGSVLSYVMEIGTIHKVSIRNMDEQHQDYLEMQKDRTTTTDTAIVAIVAGDGLGDVFASLGVSAIVSGGQTMNPSTKDILSGVERSSSDKVIILPNNKNIILTAQQVQSLTQKTVKVIPTTTVPQGVAALLAFDYDADFETNSKIMTESLKAVKSIEITRSVRSCKLNGLVIKKKQAIGLLDGDIVAVGDTPKEVLNDVLCKVGLDKAEIITMYYGADTGDAEAEECGNIIRNDHSHLQVEVVKGGQPHYNYIVSVE